MIQRATVVEKDGRLFGKVTRSEACMQCRACQFGQKETMYVDLPRGNYVPGDEVELELSEKKFTQASILAYAVPVVLLFLGLVAAYLLGASEGVQALSAFVMLMLGLLIIKLLDKKIRKSGFEPRVHPCERSEKED